jgi:hypothetical protein
MVNVFYILAEADRHICLRGQVLDTSKSAVGSILGSSVQKGTSPPTPISFEQQPTQMRSIEDSNAGGWANLCGKVYFYPIAQ